MHTVFLRSLAGHDGEASLLGVNVARENGWRAPDAPPPIPASDEAASAEGGQQ